MVLFRWNYQKGRNVLLIDEKLIERHKYPFFFTPFNMWPAWLAGESGVSLSPLASSLNIGSWIWVYRDTLSFYTPLCSEAFHNRDRE